MPSQVEAKVIDPEAELSNVQRMVRICILNCRFCISKYIITCIIIKNIRVLLFSA